jgi:hypothetical protein
MVRHKQDLMFFGSEPMKLARFFSHKQNLFGMSIVFSIECSIVHCGACLYSGMNCVEISLENWLLEGDFSKFRFLTESLSQTRNLICHFSGRRLLVILVLMGRLSGAILGGSGFEQVKNWTWPFQSIRLSIIRFSSFLGIRGCFKGEMGVEWTANAWKGSILNARFFVRPSGTF